MNEFALMENFQTEIDEFQLYTTNSLVSLHSSLTHIMEPRAKHGIDILFPASVKYSLNLMTDEQTESTVKKERKFE